jgi:hypothetical protein
MVELLNYLDLDITKKKKNVKVKTVLDPPPDFSHEGHEETRREENFCDNEGLAPFLL